jgi:hypothetical protein
MLQQAAGSQSRQQCYSPALIDRLESLSLLPETLQQLPLQDNPQRPHLSICGVCLVEEHAPYVHRCVVLPKVARGVRAVALEQQERPAAGVKGVAISLLDVAVVLDGAGCMGEGEAREAP